MVFTWYYFHNTGGPNMSERRCLGECSEWKSLSEFGTMRKHGKIYVRNKCLVCRSKEQSRRLIEKRVEENPENYKECDVCDEITKAKFNFCPNCGNALVSLKDKKLTIKKREDNEKREIN